MYTIEKLKERNAELADEIRIALGQYAASTGLLPTVEIDWVAQIGGLAQPIVRVEATIR